jgi:TonB dependent receptor/CarboxypepD_reg-like domain/TonB-dependent Receptor Plug Domain
MKYLHFTLLYLFMGFLTQNLSSQNTQIVKGTILDQQAETPLIGATIILLNVHPTVGATTNENGQFTLKNVPLGRHAFRVTYLGYNEITLPNILVTSGKEVVLNLKLEESLESLSTVVITAKVDKDKAINELATISARQFNVEEVRRYSGGRNDVAKLVTNFAGVAASNDQRNDIVIRGNSPTGVLWRLEGVPIPSPNHFSTLGTTGGPVSALNPNMISNSDFLTSAFPAEYGNALAGVFDIGFRTGNKEKTEFTAQVAAFSGFEAMVEGPMNKKQDGSYVVAYRHSFVEVAAAAGLSVGTKAVPQYRDLSFNLDLGNTKAGKLSLFGIAGYSFVSFLGKDLDSTDLFADPNTNAINTSKFGLIGLKHQLNLNEHSYLRSVISTSHAATKYDEYDLKYDANGGFQVVDFSEKLTELRLNTMYNNKINKRLTLRAGTLATLSNTLNKVLNRENTPDLDGDGFPDWFTRRDYDGRFNTIQAYTQTQYRFTEKLTLNTGLHGLYFDKTKELAIEPRVAINYHITPKSTLSIGYGLHHQNQPLPVFFIEERQLDGTYARTNENLKFSRSNHFVMGFDYKPASDWRVKTEVYYQMLDKIAVEKFPSSFSILNAGADFVFPNNGSLVNNGTGRNYGVEFTLEKFFSKGYYGLLTTSIFQSKYKGSDKIERNTAFNNEIVGNLLFGREIKLNSRYALTLDTKVTGAGGRYATPIDFEASKMAGYGIYQTNLAYSEKYSPYFRWDFKIGYRQNSSRRKLTQTFYLDFQNVTNNKNIFQKQYRRLNQTLGTSYQIGFLPDVLYRVEF